MRTFPGQSELQLYTVVVCYVVMFAEYKPSTHETNIPISLVVNRFPLPLPLPLSSALDFRPLRPFGCSLVCHHKKSSGSNV